MADIKIKVALIVCSRCNGTSNIKVYYPHVKDPDIAPCPQCTDSNTGWAKKRNTDGQSCIEIMVPDIET